MYFLQCGVNVKSLKTQKGEHMVSNVSQPGALQQSPLTLWYLVSVPFQVSVTGGFKFSKFHAAYWDGPGRIYLYDLMLLSSTWWLPGSEGRLVAQHGAKHRGRSTWLCFRMADADITIFIYIPRLFTLIVYMNPCIPDPVKRHPLLLESYHIIYFVLHLLCYWFWNI